jgi:magnesium-transporting ATPase (P-type)
MMSGLSPASKMRPSFVPVAMAKDQRISGRNKNSGTKMILQASSPDEIALVKFSNLVKMELIERDRTFVQLQSPEGHYEDYEIIANFPFSS